MKTWLIFGAMMFLGAGTVASAQELPPEEVIMVAVPEVPSTPATAAITQPAENGAEISGAYTFRATFTDNDEVVDDIDWSIRAGSCEEGWVMADDVTISTYSYVDGQFSVTLDVTTWEGGEYCFTFDPIEQEGEDDVVVNRIFTVAQLFRISGYKYEDINENRALDEQDERAADWEIKVKNNETAQQFVTTTNNDGYYEVFVPAGTWTVLEESPRGWEQIRAYQGYGKKVAVFEDEESPEIAMTCTFEFYDRSEVRRGFWYDASCSFLNERTAITKGTRTGSRDRSTAGQVLGVATTSMPTTASNDGVAPQCEGMYLTTYLRMGQDNDADAVKKLQIFLNAIGIVLLVTGEFDLATDAAVRQFQLKYLTDVLSPWGIADATGYVYKTTRAKINNMVCPGSEPVPTI
jgi:hypothetical protein